MIRPVRKTDKKKKRIQSESKTMSNGGTCHSVQSNGASPAPQNKVADDTASARTDSYPTMERRKQRF